MRCNCVDKRNSLYKRIFNKGRKYVSLFVIFILVMIEFTSGIKADNSENSDGKTLLYDFILEKKVETEDDTQYQEIKNGDVIYCSDDIRLKYTFTDLIPDNEGNRENNQDSINIKENMKYYFPVPEQLQVNATTTWSVYLDDNKTKLGEAVYISESNQIEFVFDSGMFSDENAYEVITNAYLSFNAKLNANKLSEEEEQAMEFGFGSNATFTFIAGDKLAGDNKISKTGTYNEDTKEITWTVTVIESGKNYTENLLLEDTMSSNQQYVAGSMTMQSGTDSAKSVEPIISDNTISYEFTPTNKKGNVITFTYKTKLNNEIYLNGTTLIKSGTEIEAGNEAYLKTKSGNILASKETTVSIPGHDYTWCKKEQTTIDVVDDVAIATWTIDVNTNGFEFCNFTVFDKSYATSSEEFNYRIDTTSFKVYEINGDQETLIASGSEAMGEITSTPGNGVVNYTWEYAFSGETAVSGHWRVEYQTKIDNYSKYLMTNPIGINNNAWLKFGWYDFDGTGAGNVKTGLTSPGSFVKMEGSTAEMLKKTFGKYNPDNNRILWNVTLNKGKLTIDENYYLIDTIGGISEDEDALEQTYIVDEYGNIDFSKVITNVRKAGRAVSDETVEKYITCTLLDETHVKIEFDAEFLTDNYITFEFKTKLDPSEAEYYEDNHSSELENVRKAYNTMTLYRSRDDAEMVSVTANGDIEREIFDKCEPDYDYNTRILTWTLLAGTNITSTGTSEDVVPLNDVVIEDTIEYGTLLTDSITICKMVDGDGELVLTTTPNENGQYYTYDSQTGKLKIYLGDVEYYYKITFGVYLEDDTVIMDDGVEKKIESYSGEICVTNEATLKIGETNDVIDSGTGTINNVNITKEGIDNTSTKGVISYTLKLNQNQCEWTSSRQVIDIMSPGLIIKPETIVMYEASVDSSTGELTVGEVVDASKYSIIIQTLEEDNSDLAATGSTKMTIKPLQDMGNKAYILVYDCTIDEEFAEEVTAFTNELKMDGVEYNADMASVLFAKLELDGFGGGGLSVSQSKVKIRKVCASNEDSALKGAKYTLYLGDTAIITKTTNENGEATFYGLEAGKTYTIKEVAAPNGYVLDETESGTWTFVAPASTDTSYIINPHIFKNEVISLVIFNRDEDGNGLKDCTFGLFSESETEFTSDTAIKTVDSNSLGVVDFDYTVAGTYQIVELEAADGYEKSDDILITTIDDNGAMISIYNKTDADKNTQIVVTNNPIKETTEPSTEPSTEATTEPSTEPSTEASTESTTESTTEQTTEITTQGNTEEITDGNTGDSESGAEVETPATGDTQVLILLGILMISLWGCVTIYSIKKYKI